MSPVEGILSIRLHRHDGAYRARISSTRPIFIAHLFEGRPARAVLEFIPLLFSICAKAHSVAAVRALESAAGLSAPVQTERVRNLVLLAENLREHLLRIHMDWPAASAMPLPPRRLATVNRISQALLASLPTQAAFRLPGSNAPPPTLDIHAVVGALETLHAFVEQEVLGISCRAFSGLCDCTAFDAWRQGHDTVATRFMNHLSGIDIPSTGGRAAPRPLPELPAESLAQVLSGPRAAKFIARPLWNGRCHETGPYSRCHDAPLLATLSRHGALTPRYTARLLELTRTLREIETLCRLPVTETELTTAGGLACVEAARGRLAHWVRLDGERVAQYRILAPTEWNFHPRGIAAHLMSLIPPGPAQTVLRQARLAAAAVDPCIGYDLEMADPTPSEPTHA